MTDKPNVCKAVSDSFTCQLLSQILEVPPLKLTVSGNSVKKYHEHFLFGCFFCYVVCLQKGRELLGETAKREVIFKYFTTKAKQAVMSDDGKK